MISTGRPSSPPLALTSSRQISIAACSIFPAGAPAPVSASDIPTFIGSAACAGIAASNSTAAAAPSARRDSCTMASSLKAEARLFLSRIPIRIDQRSGLGLRRPHYRLRLAVAELIEVVRLCVLDLRPVHARLRPFSVLCEGEIPRNGLEARLVHVFGKLVMIEAFGLGHRLRQHLAASVGEWAPGEPQRIDARRRSFFGVALEEFRGAGNARSRCRRIVLAGDEAVGDRAEL